METTLPLKRVAARLQTGTTKSTRPMLHDWMQYRVKQPCTQLQIQMADRPFGFGCWILSALNALPFIRSNVTMPRKIIEPNCLEVDHLISADAAKRQMRLVVNGSGT
jgi:hypothetical protein